MGCKPKSSREKKAFPTACYGMESCYHRKLHSLQQIMVFLLLIIFFSSNTVHYTQGFIIKPVPICSARRGLSQRQQILCHQFRKHMEYIVDGGKIALEECKKQFKERRWNCTFPKGQSRGFLTPNMPRGSKEAAFVHAIVAAGTMHAISRACMETKLPTFCQCSREPRPGNLDSKYVWGGCGDNLPYGYEFSKKFVDAREDLGEKASGNIARILMNLHNSEAGRLAVIRRSRVQCRCHGLSKGCAVKTCYRQLAEFSDVGDYLKDKYESSIEVELTSQISSQNGMNTELKLRELNTQYRPMTREDLVSTEESPNYCIENHEIGSLGTHGRECNKTSEGLDGCKLLCCGRGYRTKRQLSRDKCGCQFIWCCFVKCKTCEKEMNVHYCK